MVPSRPGCAETGRLLGQAGAGDGRAFEEKAARTWRVRALRGLKEALAALPGGPLGMWP
jgi:hypothetical protein